jgi:hypothetical protein
MASFIFGINRLFTVFVTSAGTEGQVWGIRRRLSRFDLGDDMTEGYYAATFGTILGFGHIRLKLADNSISGTTARGVPVEGHYIIDDLRGLVRFEAAAHLPPFFTAVTGLSTEAKPRSVKFKGEATPTASGARFSIDFAGRALDVEARYDGAI